MLQLWTAARYRLPLLAIIANNASYYNDEVHQERVAKHRGRPVENVSAPNRRINKCLEGRWLTMCSHSAQKWIGMRLDDPQPNVHKMAEGLGCTIVTDEQVKTKDELRDMLQRAVKALRDGKPVVLDVRVRPDDYSSNLEKAK